MSNAYLTIGERIKSARTLAGMTQGQLAEAIGTGQANISHYEAGRQKPSADVSDRIFAVLRHASSKAAELLDTYDGVLGIQGRSAGKLGMVLDPMAPPVPKEWLVDGFLARRHVTILAGQEGAGKSMLAQTVAVALADGRPEVFGFRTQGRALRVLIIDVENVLMIDDDLDPSGVTERLQAFGMTQENKHGITIVGTQGFDLDSDSDTVDGVLGDAAKRGEPYDAVIFDSFRSLWTSGSENTPSAGRVLMKYMRMAHKHNVGMVVLHHTNKAGAAYSGHTSIGSTVSALWTFSRMVQKSPETGKKEQHPTLRWLAPYKVRIAPEARGRVVFTSSEGIQAPLSAEEYDGAEVDPGTLDDSPEE